jgi:CheY-like chemotaxis protein
MSDLPRTVLCVDDDADDREMICYAINQIEPSFEVVHAKNGVEAIDYLIQAKSTQTLPCLVIMDINMPKMDGKQTLGEMKKDEQLSELPVVIFSTSDNPSDKLYCEQYGAELVTKPSSMASIKEEVKKLLHHCDPA